MNLTGKFKSSYCDIAREFAMKEVVACGLFSDFRATEVERIWQPDEGAP